MKHLIEIKKYKNGMMLYLYVYDDYSKNTEVVYSERPFTIDNAVGLRQGGWLPKYFFERRINCGYPSDLYILRNWDEIMKGCKSALIKEML